MGNTLNTPQSHNSSLIPRWTPTKFSSSFLWTAFWFQRQFNTLGWKYKGFVIKQPWVQIPFRKLLCVTWGKLLRIWASLSSVVKRGLIITATDSCLKDKWDHRSKHSIQCSHQGKVIPSFLSFLPVIWTKDQTDFSITHNQFYSRRYLTIFISVPISELIIKA